MSFSSLKSMDAVAIIAQSSLGALERLPNEMLEKIFFKFLQEAPLQLGTLARVCKPFQEVLSSTPRIQLLIKTIKDRNSTRFTDIARFGMVIGAENKCYH